MANGNENIQSTLPCGKKAPVVRALPATPKPRPVPPPKPPVTYELKVKVIENTKDKKAVGSIRVQDFDDDNKMADVVTSGAGLATFSNIKTSGDKALKLADFDAEKYKVEDYYGPFTPERTGKGTINEIKIDPIIRIYLKPIFKDPEKNERSFPEGFSVNMKFENEWDGKSKERKVKINKDGLLSDGKNAYVEVLRSVKSFTLEFGQGSEKFFVCEKQGENIKPTELKERKDLDMAKSHEFRAIKIPQNQWTLENSDWTCKDIDAFNKKEFKFHKIEVLATKIGSPDTPAKLELNMHWQFLRYTYYDRWLMGNERISILPVMIEGFADKAETNKWFEESNWYCNSDNKKYVQCIPWIVQKADKPKPDAKTLIQFNTKANTFIETAKDKSSRKVVINLADNIIRTPNAERLRYYDLPVVWKSQNYYCKIDTSENRFETVADKPATLEKPITFCLDDIVLTDKNLKPLTSNAGAAADPLDITKWGPKDRVALISHYFSDKKYDGNTNPQPASLSGKLSRIGVYNPQKPDHLYFSKEPTGLEVNRNYIADYPDWTRLLFAKGNMFDVFDKRVKVQAAPTDKDVVGARAAVLWVPSTQPFPGIETWENVGGSMTQVADGIPKPKRLLHPRKPDLTKSAPFFAVQPFFEARTSVRYSEAFNEGNDEGGGRFDMTLIRCCDYDGDKEIAVNLHYFRYFFDFTKATPAIGKEPFKNLIMDNVAARWNGDENLPRKRIKILPRDANIKIEVPVVWFSQALDFDISHFNVDVLPTTPDGRDNRGSYMGTGESQTDNFEDTGDWFTSAHECGHADSLADEYNERWDGLSYDQLSLKCNLPGDPYERDGRSMANLDNSVPVGSPIMNGNQIPRNRNFWHSAEWVRHVIDPSQKFKVKMDGYENYFVPPHNKPERSYAFWPIEHQLNFNAAPVAPFTKNRCDIDLYLYTHGEEKYTKEITAGDIYDGVLMVILKLKCELAYWAAAADNEQKRKDILMNMTNGVDGIGGFNNKYYLKGTVKDGSDQKWEFKRCLIHFSPRYLVANPASVNIAPPAKIAHAKVVVASGADDPAFPMTLDEAKLIAQADEIETALGTAYHIVVRKNATPVCEWIGLNPKPEIMSADTWNAESRATTANHQAIKTKLQEYHAISEADIIARINKCPEIFVLCVKESVNDIMTSVQWLKQSNIKGASRSVHNLKDIDARVTAYHSLAKDDYGERVKSLRGLVDACTLYVTSTKATSKIAHPINYSRIPDVEDLKSKANFKLDELISVHLGQQVKDRKDYLTRGAESKKLSIQYVSDGTWLNRIRLKFKDFFPGLLGIYKTPDKVTTADMNEWLTALNLKSDGTAEIKEI